MCSGFWVKGFEVEVDQDKSSVYLKRASSLVLTSSWLLEAGNMIIGLGGHVGPSAAQALPLGAAFPPLHPCLALEAQKVTNQWQRGRLSVLSTCSFQKETVGTIRSKVPAP